MSEPTLPERACDACTVCCTALTIEDPALVKLEGHPCRYLAAAGCGIYATRPQTCRQFECGWKRFKWVKPGLRPDRSGVLVQVDAAGAVVVTLLSARALEADGLAETVAAVVAAGREVFLNVPGRPGFTASKGRIDEALRPLVARRDKVGLLRFLREAREQGESTGGNIPIRLGRR